MDLPILCKQAHWLGRSLAHLEIDARLFVPFGVLFPPQCQQKRRELRKDDLRPVDLRVTARPGSDHQMQHGLARFQKMHAWMGITATPADVSITL